LINETKFTLVGKLYVWSISMELLLYFGASHFLGMRTSIARILQILVIIALILHLKKMYRFGSLANPLHSYYKTFWIYYLFSIFSIFYGIFFYGTYDAVNLSGGKLIRPVVEYILILFNFIYFVIIPSYILANNSAINYFFKIFHRVFLISLVLGVADLIVVVVFSSNLISRHIHEDIHIGFRFHGLFGEPREAFGPLFLWIGILYLRSYWQDRKRVNKGLILIIVVAMLLTQSGSGILGIMLSAVLVFLFYIHRVSFKNKLKIFSMLFLCGLVVNVSIEHSKRLSKYKDAIVLLYENADIYDISPHLKAQEVDIYPIWQRLIEVKELNIMPFFIGTGQGSGYVINYKYMNEDDATNPNSNLVRTFYESGFIGLFLFTIFFLYPIKKIFHSKQLVKKYTLIMLVIVGLFLGHRTAIPYIFLGVLIAVVNQKVKNNYIWNISMRSSFSIKDNLIKN
jgi:hypothetical protein